MQLYNCRETCYCRDRSKYFYGFSSRLTPSELFTFILSSSCDVLIRGRIEWKFLQSSCLQPQQRQRYPYWSLRSFRAFTGAGTSRPGSSVSCLRRFHRFSSWWLSPSSHIYLWEQIVCFIRISFHFSFWVAFIGKIRNF